MPATPGDYVGATTHTGPLNANLTIGDTDTIGAFLSSGGGVYTRFSGSGAALSTAPFATTILFVITGQGYAGEAGSVTRDDGAPLYQDGKAVFSSQNPTAATTSAFRLRSSDPFQLYRIEANGLPATLSFPRWTSRCRSRPASCCRAASCWRWSCCAATDAGRLEPLRLRDHWADAT